MFRVHRLTEVKSLHFLYNQLQVVERHSIRLHSVYVSKSEVVVVAGLVAVVSVAVAVVERNRS